jgi:hypothetical protein
MLAISSDARTCGARFTDLLEERTRDHVPLDWATTQNNLGIALLRHGEALLRRGERESGTARLEEAVVAHRAALEEMTRERVPLGWAQMQFNLGATLFRLGEQANGTVQLEEAVSAYRAGSKLMGPRLGRAPSRQARVATVRTAARKFRTLFRGGGDEVAIWSGREAFQPFAPCLTY